MSFDTRQLAGMRLTLIPLPGRGDRYGGSARMRQFQFIQASQQIEQPTCPQCGAAMWLARIEPDKPDHDRRTFECPVCDHVVRTVVKYK
jgi:hypothetical protein